MQITDGLTLLLMGLIAVCSLIGGAIVVLMIQKSKGNVNKAREDAEKELQKESLKAKLPKEDVKKFMEFDDIEDDMIVQDKGNRFVMVLKCTGINYDLMSEPEMLAVEEGFGNFLNTLKYPIQLYVQARSLNLEEGIDVYKKRLQGLKGDYDKYASSVSQAKKNPRVTEEQKAQMDFEIKKKRILLDYGADIVNYIEKMSMNRNILQRKYYVVVSYHTSELGIATSFSKEEARDVAYSELYTRCRSIQAALVPCGIESTILKSEDLAELLYIAYNKDEADTYNLRKAIENGYYRLYSTSEDVQEKKKKALDKEIQEKAIAEAEEALQNAIKGLNQKYQGTSVAETLTEEEKKSDAIKAEAMQIIIDNQDQFDVRAVDKALTDLNSQMKKPIVEVKKEKKDEEALDFQKPQRDSDAVEAILNSDEQ